MSEEHETNGVAHTNGQPQRKRLSRNLQKEEVEVEQEDGSIKVWTVYEATGSQRNEWLNFMETKYKRDKNGNTVGIKDSHGVQERLLSFCVKDENNKLLNEQQIAKLPSSLQFDLFEIAQRLSRLSKTPTQELDDAKNA